MRITMTLCVLLALVATGGCGGKKTTTIGGTSVTTSDDDKTTTVSGEGGSVTIGAKAVDASKLGAPLYPGATQDAESGSMSVTTSEATTSAATLKTTDPFDKVYDFYKTRMPAGSEKLKMSAGGSSMATFQVGDSDAKETVLVTIAAKDGESTTISINHAVKNGAATASAGPSSAPSPAPAASDGGG
jgi:hypothetical protein